MLSNLCQGLVDSRVLCAGLKAVQGSLCLRGQDREVGGVGGGGRGGQVDVVVFEL